MQFLRHLLPIGLALMFTGTFAAPPSHPMHPPAPQAYPRMQTAPQPSQRMMHPARKPTASLPGRHTLIISEDRRLPLKLTIKRGDSVTWLNQDRDTQTVTAEYEIFDSGKLAAGESYTHTFARSGTFHFYRRLDRHVSGVIQVK